MKKIILYPFIFFLFSSCLYELPISFEDAENLLVVEGYVSDLSEIHYIKLSNVTNYNGISSDNSFVSGAQVIITEIGGSSYPFYEISKGLYQFLEEDFIGQKGKSYQLDITLSNGEKYQSSIETILDKVTIISGEATYRERDILNERDVPRTIKEHFIEIEIENTFKNHFYKLENSGWGEVDVTSFNRCWTYRDPIVGSQLIINDNIGLNDENYKLETIGVPIDYKGQYVAFIRLNSMSDSSYNFWNKVNDQLTRSGSSFDHPFAPIRGNIIHINGNKSALGYFHAYATSYIEIYFDRSEVVAIPVSTSKYCSYICIDPLAKPTFEDISELFCN